MNDETKDKKGQRPLDGAFWVANPKRAWLETACERGFLGRIQSVQKTTESIVLLKTGTWINGLYQIKAQYASGEAITKTLLIQR
jgi:hypothetical protein